MPVWASLADVQKRVTYETIDATSQPTSAQVEEWLDESEAILRGHLSSLGLSTTATGDAALILGKLACDYGEARVKMAWASAKGDGNEDGEAAMLRFREGLEELRGGFYSEILQAGASSKSSLFLRSHATSGVGGKSIARGDFDPVFTTEEKF